VHSTVLGPSLGGTRFLPYDSLEQAAVDVCRLARGMTYKHAACGNHQGGGKAVIIGDPAVTVAYARRDVRPSTAIAPLTSEAFRAIESAVTKHYQAVTLPTMSTGATDMAYLRAKGVQCYGVGPALDEEDGPKGFGAHSDQERILETELHRFVRFHYEVVRDLARAN